MADTIKSGITLTEGGTLLQESVRFEGEPWTFFYKAGENIRELRKALENKQVGIPAPKNGMRKAA